MEIIKYIYRRRMSISVWNVIKYIVLACLFSTLSNVVISYLERQFEFGTSYVGQTTFSNVNFDSSVWCQLDNRDNSHRTCAFSNLCWLPSEDQFIFLLGEESIFHGVADWRNIANLDFSSVAGHNQFTLKIAVVSIPVAEQHPLGHHKIIRENESVYFLWRFKPDNIMHIVHDDLLPLYYAYEELCSGNVQACAEKYKLIFVDNVRSDFNSDLYQLFSRKLSDSGHQNDGKLFFLKDNFMLHPNTSICFSHASIGLPRTTSWFQYGFGKPQGAIEGSGISIPMIKRFTKFVLSQMGIPLPDEGDELSSPRAIYVSRSFNRRILNEMDVITTSKNIYSELMENNLPLQIDYFNPAPNSSSSGFKEMLHVILRKPLPKFIFGMHSAALTVAGILCLGIKKKDMDLSFMELFPLGIDPVAVSPLRALIRAIALQDSNHIFYEHWTNTDPSNSILPSTHTSPLVGGGDICKGLNLIPVLHPVECCHNSHYLCRMFQDTVVDTKFSFPDKLMSLFRQIKKFKAQHAENYHHSHYHEFRWFFPASVNNIQCSWNITENEGYLILSWNSPINVYIHSHYYAVAVRMKYINGTTVNELGQETILSEKSVDLNLMVQNTSTKVPIPKQFIQSSSIRALQANIWIQCFVSLTYMQRLEHSSSLDAFHKCSVQF